jgi:hypothetical protein
VAVVREETETIAGLAEEEVVVGRALEVGALVAVVVAIATVEEVGGADEELMTAELTVVGADVVVAIGVEEEVWTEATVIEEEEEIAIAVEVVVVAATLVAGPLHRDVSGQKWKWNNTILLTL